MKNFYFSLWLFIRILFGSTVSNLYVKQQMMTYFTYFSTLENKSIESLNTKTEIIKDKFYRQKNMLRLFINKEHIKELESSILLIENLIENNDISDITETKIETICLINQITDYMTAIN